jgi:uncharacterized membrane protein YciS (DUF1049 family)
MLNLAKFCLTVAVIACASVGSSVIALAQDSTVTFTPLVQFGEVFNTITTTIAPLITAGLVLGLGIWGTFLIFRLVKKAGRG